MKFYVLENGKPDYTLEPSVCLVKDGWNDWYEFKTLYGVFYTTSDTIEWIGSTKIGQKGLKPDPRKYVSPDIEESFTELGEEFFSIGQDVSYYTNLNKYGEDFRIGILKSLRDIALDETVYEEVKDEYVLRQSLLRDVSRVSVKGQYRKLANGNAELSEYYFNFKLPDNKLDSKLTIRVTPNEMPPMNIHVLIGRNGVGKTYLIRRLINCILSSSSEFGEIQSESIDDTFAGLLLVSFSAFDNEYSYSAENKTGINFTRIGLIKFEENKFIPKTFDDTVEEFFTSLLSIKSSGKSVRWKKTISMLYSDPIFSSIGIDKLIEDHSITKAKQVFEKLSSGHKIVLLTITQLVEKVEEKTLVVLDEPELHLHPPLLSAFTRALSELLILRNAVALVATHSPVIVQEVPSECVKIMNRTNELVNFVNPSLETFGENIGTLTREIFGLEVRESGYHKMLTDLVNSGYSYEDIVTILRGRLGHEAKTLIRSMIFSRGEE